MKTTIQIFKSKLSKQELKQLIMKAEYFDEVLMSVDCLSTRKLANEMSMSGPDLYCKLMRWGIVYKQGANYLLYADYARMHLAKTRTIRLRNRLGIYHTRRYLMWTEKGRRLIHEKWEQEKAFMKELDQLEFC